MSKFLAIFLLLLSSSLEIRKRENPKNDIFTWMGYDWFIRDETWAKAEPGPNYYFGENLDIPDNEYDPLTMQITREGRDTYCSEFYMTEALGYGQYEIEIHQKVEDIANADSRAVFGFFLYRDDSYEIDTEISKWGNDRSDAPNMDYITKPYIEGRTGTKFLLPSGHQKTRHIIEWHPDIIKWRTEDINTGAVIHEWSTIEQVRREDPTFVPHLSFWMYEGSSPKAAPLAVTIDRFRFTKY